MKDLTAVRDEDRFDVAKMHTWLRPFINEGQLPEVMQFRSGASNLTYLLSYSERDLVLRKPPVGTKAASAHDMKREYLIQSRLQSVYPLVPKMIALCDDQSVMGSDFYVMERVEGEIFRRDIPEAITAADISVMADSLINGLVQLHAVDSSILKELNRGAGYVQRQVEGWSKRYRNALTDDVPAAEKLMAWLAANQPDDVDSCIIHGDWRIDNMVFDLGNARIAGVLDWELATVGDPLMDLGSALAYWVDRDDESAFASLRRQPSHLPGMPTREEFLQRYLQLSGRKCADFTFYEVFGLFRLAVIIQQIWARFRAGQTTNPAFAGFGDAVNTLITRAEGKIS
jgi:aminoglycoside phosphotransferase (APT) family kinase protein